MDQRDMESLLARVHRQIDLEVEADIEGLYEFIDPRRRGSREARDDEPEVTRSVIEEFVTWVKSAVIVEVEVTDEQPCDPRREDRPSAKVHTEIHYNKQENTYRFKAVWVREGETWFTTSMGKIRPGPAVFGGKSYLA